LSEQVADYLSSQIKGGDLQPGEKLPSEAKLAKQFNVSRTVIREALARLKYEGLISSKNGVGAVLTQAEEYRAFCLDRVEEADSGEIGHLFELRAILEGNAAALAAKRGSGKDLNRLRQCLEEMAHALEVGDDGTAPDNAFHQIVAEASGNPYLRDFMRFLNGRLRDQIQRSRDRSNQVPGLPLKVHQEHVNIFEAIANHQPERAREAALAHIEKTTNRLGAVISVALRSTLES